MRLLHTSDWHVGKLIRGQSRADEHRAVLAEIAAVAAAEAVDLVLVAGDLFETSAPGPESEAIVYRGLLDLAEVAPVVVIGGNHDNPRRLHAVAPLLSLGRVTVVGQPAAPDAGGTLHLDAGGTPVCLALLPFVSKRLIVKAEDLMADDAYQHAQAYDDRVRWVLSRLCEPFGGDTVNLVCAHAFAAGGTTGGGERSVHTIEDYSVGAQAFPVGAQYVALGHLHRAQDIPGPTRIHYSGSPMQLDFGEGRDTKSVAVVELEPGVPASVRDVPLTAGRALQTLTGSLAELEAVAGSTGDAYLRVIVNDARRAGLADQIREWFPHCVDVVVRAPEDRVVRPHAPVVGREPGELFRTYLDTTDLTDDRVPAAFDALLEEVTS